MNRKRIVAIAVVLGVLALGGYFAYRSAGRGQELKLYGNVDIREVELSFRVPGRIAAVNVDEGDRVKPGDVLATLDARRYRDALAKAQAERDAAAANMAKYKAGNRAEDIAQARAKVDQLAAQAKNAAALARRHGELLKSGAVSQQDYDDTIANRDNLSAQLESARKALQLQNAGFRAEDIQAAAASLRSAEAALAAAQTDMVDTQIHAPSGGTVLSRVREPGAMAEAGANILVLSLDRPVWVRAYVPEAQLGRVSMGMPVLVHTDGRPGKPYKGTVGFISPVAEFTPKNVETEALRTALVYRLRIVVDEPDEGLRQGMPVSVTPDPAGTPRPAPPAQIAAAQNAAANSTTASSSNATGSAAQ